MTIQKALGKVIVPQRTFIRLLTLSAATNGASIWAELVSELASHAAQWNVARRTSRSADHHGHDDRTQNHQDSKTLHIKPNKEFFEICALRGQFNPVLVDHCKSIVYLSLTDAHLRPMGNELS